MASFTDEKTLRRGSVAVSLTPTSFGTMYSVNKTNKNITHLAVECPDYKRGGAITKVLSRYAKSGRVLVFSSTRDDCSTILHQVRLSHTADMMHGNVPQDQREETL